ncbi:heterokaryon incompatibility protein-domain-containing protein, partial [Phaeosphaeria sp. MPI-PUGE-AT-0046c]
TGSPAAIALAKYWIQNCIQNHSSCSRPNVQQYSPTRLIDLHDERIKLVHDPTLCADYVALSHRWGSEELPTTVSTNYERRLREMAPEELTQTMRDAMAFTRHLGYNYLWIDALCIVQDSEEDWLREAAKMSDVFSGAIVTIAVADAENHSEGMFRPRPARCMRPFAIPYIEQTSYCERVHLDGEGEFCIFPNTEHVSAGTRRKGALDTRGWILQEQILSRRILYFGRGELFWDCNTLSASESSPISTSLLDEETPDETWALQVIRRTLSATANPKTLRQRLSDIWIQVIRNYSSRQLSHQRDRLVALQGILHPLAKILQEEPVAGMWRTQLWWQLIWWTPMPGPIDSETPTEMVFPAPSWSWLASRGPV